MTDNTQLLARISELQNAHDNIKRLYDDLIFQVSRKFKHETRHQTAKRYIASWEGRCLQLEVAKSATVMADFQAGPEQGHVGHPLGRG